MCLWNYISGNRDYQTKILIWRNKKTKAIYFMGTGTPSWSILLSAPICTCVCTRTDSRPDGRMEAFIISPSLFQKRGDKERKPSQELLWKQIALFHYTCLIFLFVFIFPLRLPYPFHPENPIPL